MSDIRVDTASIPTYVADALCADLLAGIKAYMRRPGAAEELQRRGEEFYRRKAEKEAQERSKVYE
ncbi:MAG: hypothetical protein J6A19_04875 [Oscillospiraceae bacterium]|nr:hypothetical protein [Oscillospiraceae bacterium]